MILVLGHVARVHPTANSLLCAVCRYESGERTQLPYCRDPGSTPDEAHLPDADNPSNWISSEWLTIRSEQSLNTTPLHASVLDWNSNNSGTNSP